MSVIPNLVGGAPALRANVFAIDDPDFRGGARIALGDVDGDGRADLFPARQTAFDAGRTQPPAPAPTPTPGIGFRVEFAAFLPHRRVRPDPGRGRGRPPDDPQRRGGGPGVRAAPDRDGDPAAPTARAAAARNNLGSVSLGEDVTQAEAVTITNTGDQPLRR